MRKKVIVSLCVIILLTTTWIYLDSSAKQYLSAPLNANTNITRAETPRTMFMHNNTTGTPQLITNGTYGTRDPTYYESIPSGTNKTWVSVPPIDEERYIDNIYARLYLEPRLELERLFSAVPDTRALQHGILNFSGDAGSSKINGTAGSEAGFSVAVVDLNNDYYDDVVIGAPYN
ncbi:MAG: integrin alpha [Thermoplasmata archaeon]